jgi:hypothetical protein
MPVWLQKIFESINIFPSIQKHFWSILLFISILGWSIFLLPIGLFQTLQIEKLRSKYIELIGLATFLSTICLCFGLVYKGYQFLKRQFTEKRKCQEQQKLLDGLTPVEYEGLQNFTRNNSQTATFSLYDGVVAGLIDKGILYKPNSQSNTSGEQDFNLYPWAYEYLQKHQDLFKKRK